MLFIFLSFYAVIALSLIISFSNDVLASDFMASTSSFSYSAFILFFLLPFFFFRIFADILSRTYAVLLSISYAAFFISLS
jgi:hypothetical protein